MKSRDFKLKRFLKNKERLMPKAPTFSPEQIEYLKEVSQPLIDEMNAKLDLQEEMSKILFRRVDK